MIAQVLKYPGSKHRLADWIVSHFPAHTTYVEPFAGSLAVLFAKPRSAVEVVNDLDGRIANFWRVLRDAPEDLCRAVDLTPYSRQEFCESFEVSADPTEDARRLLVNCWQGWPNKNEGGAGWRRQLNNGRGTTPPGDFANLPSRIAAAANRLKRVYVEQRDALTLIQEFGHAGDDATDGALIYADPPYVLSSVSSPNHYYVNGYDNHAHERLLAALGQCRGPVLLSGYESRLYADVLTGWRAVKSKAFAQRSRVRTEVLWLNPVASEMLEGRLF